MQANECTSPGKSISGFVFKATDARWGFWLVLFATACIHDNSQASAIAAGLLMGAASLRIRR